MLHQNPATATANANPFTDPALLPAAERAKPRDPYAAYRAQQLRDSFDGLYRKKGLHPGGNFKFSCHVHADMSREDKQRFAGGRPWHSITIVPTAFSRDGTALENHVALFVHTTVSRTGAAAPL